MKQLLLATFLTTTMVFPVMSEEFSKADIENIIKEYIQKNPGVILDSVEAYGRGQQEAEMKDRQKAVEENLSWLEDNEMLPVAGNPNGDVTVIEFFDYNCGYCKKALVDVTTLMGEDKNVKFVFVEMPILGRTSELAAKWAMAAKEQDAYLEYHIALMENRGPITESTLEKIAAKIGLNVEKIREDANSEETQKIVNLKTEKASQMGISGTPAFIIGGQLYGGYIGLESMKKAVAEARER